MHVRTDQAPGAPGHAGIGSKAQKPLPITLALTCCLIAGTASADLADKVNTLRSQGCGVHAAPIAKVRPSKHLDKVAREWSNGGRLREALARTGYRAVNSASMNIKGAPSDDKIIQTLAKQYCETITDPQFTEIGVFSRGRETSIVVATPFSAPGIREATAIGNQVLALVNDARSKQRRCGKNTFPPAPPLTLSAMLTHAALKHAQDMASHNLFEHTGSDGSTPSQRVTRAGYKWHAVAENIAAGPTTSQEVVDGWLKSPGHCVNIMSPAYTQMGIAYAVNEQSDAGIYWAQEFATPE